MKFEDVRARIRRWNEIYVADDTRATYRGLLLWKDEGRSVVVQAGLDKTGTAIRTTGAVPIEEIREIVALDDPPWLIDSNAAAIMIKARNMLPSDEPGS